MASLECIGFGAFRLLFLEGEGDRQAAGRLLTRAGCCNAGGNCADFGRSIQEARRSPGVGRPVLPSSSTSAVPTYFFMLGQTFFIWGILGSLGNRCPVQWPSRPRRVPWPKRLRKAPCPLRPLPDAFTSAPQREPCSRRPRGHRPQALHVAMGRASRASPRGSLSCARYQRQRQLVALHPPCTEVRATPKLA